MSIFFAYQHLFLLLFSLSIERLLAAQADKPHQLFADAPPTQVNAFGDPSMMVGGGVPPPPTMPPPGKSPSVFDKQMFRQIQKLTSSDVP